MKGVSETESARSRPGVQVSVIVPVFNVEEYLEQCITSVLAQTHDALDVVLVDDGSTDGSGPMCDSMAEQDPRVRVVHQPNRGLSAARNSGLVAATGELVTFLDADDWWEPTFVSTLVDALVKHPEAGTAVAGFVRVPGQPSGSPTATPRLFTIEETLRLFAGNHHTLLTIACAKLFRRGVLDEVTFPEARLHEDEFTTYRFLARAPTVVVPEHLYLYRQRSSGIASQTLTPERLLDAVEASEQQMRDFRDWGHHEAEAWARDQALRKRLRLISLLRRSGRGPQVRLHGEAVAALVRRDTDLHRPLGLQLLRHVARVSPRAAAIGLDLVTRARSIIARGGPVPRARP